MTDDSPSEEDLKDKLTTINGIGESRADLILDYVFEFYNWGGEDRSDELREQLETALEYLDQGRPEYAEKFIRRAHSQLADSG